MRQDAPRNFRFPSAALSAAFPAVSTNGCYRDRKSTRLNSSHGYISYAVFCLKKKKHDARLFFGPAMPIFVLPLALCVVTPVNNQIFIAHAFISFYQDPAITLLSRFYQYRTLF